MPKTISTITIHNAPDSAALDIGGVTNVMSQLTEFVTTTYKLRDPGSLRLLLQAGSPFMKGAAARTHFTDNQVVKITYDDASESYWRVVKADIEHAGDRPTAITCWPYWTMLDRRAVRVQRSPNAFVDVTLALTGLSVADALGVITGSSYNAPPYFQAGTVDSAFSSSAVVLESNGESHLDLLWKLMDDLAEDNSGRPAEFEVEWNSGDSKFDINIKTAIGLTAGEESGGADPSLRPIDSPTGGAVENVANRIKLRQTTGAKDYFNRIVPVSSTEEEPITLGQCEWDISSFVTDTPSAGQTTINLRGAAFVYDIDIDASGTRYFGNEDGGFYEILSVTDADTFVVSGTVLGLGGIGRFASDASGQELVFLELAEADSENDVAERTIPFDIPPFNNWLSDTDLFAGANVASADLSEWSSGLPDGWEGCTTSDGSSVSSPTITEVTDAQYVRYGTSSAKVVANTGQGICTSTMVIRPTERNPYYSCYVNLYVESGRIRITLLDANGTEWPTGEEQAESNSRELRAISIGGMEPIASVDDPFGFQTATLRINALADGTVFYVDSATVTRTTYPIQYRGRMGLNEMWRAAARYLSENGGSLSSYDAELFDVTHFQTGSYSEIEIGSWVRIRDAFNGSSYDLQVDARVVELQEVEHPVDGRFHKFIKISTERDTASSRLIGRRPAASVPDAAPALTTKAPASGAAISQQYFLGTYSAGEVVSGVDVPLRAAPSPAAVSGAYVLNAETISDGSTDYLTVTLKNFTQSVDIGSIDTSLAAIERLTVSPLTLTADAASVVSDDVLYVALEGSGSGKPTTQMVMVLESGSPTASAGNLPTEADTLYFAHDGDLKSAPIDLENEPWSVSTL
ncbi:MAG TPA: hypothetical protein VKP65_01395, partial [Rhodothermales bacterium]|nr:hypothetical protein [Rhodothermales bacterium]